MAEVDLREHDERLLDDLADIFKGFMKDCTIENDAKEKALGRFDCAIEYMKGFYI